MWWGGDDVVEILRGGAVLMFFLLVSSPHRVVAATEFTVYRLQQYQIHGNNYGRLPNVDNWYLKIFFFLPQSCFLKLNFFVCS